MPEVSRRTVMASVLGGLGVAVAAPATPVLAAAGVAAPVSAAPAAPGTAAQPALPVRSLFTPAIGRPFRAVDGDRTLDLRLTAVDDLGPDSAGDEHRFALRFTASGFDAADGTFTLRRAGAPDVQLFLTPIGPRGLTRTLQAVVNRTA
ncbi:hypothetical protein P5G50_01435 [Leifsonia sp. F6_8S_P_1B]|uniref:DUF6916 domain-containing protein n=1 Tax=Leifsonia williamsii TaxID=3035919 RepID=A0ABT8K6M5_9MICO|nr:hypothetical protein [Leifsonia williamsii]MDN4613100.1 hypothetical protein [Leifsonia williamsii]